MAEDNKNQAETITEAETTTPDDTPKEPQAEQKDEPKPESAVKKRVLIVEDSIPLQRMLEKLMVKEDLEVITANNGRLALEVLKGENTPPLDLMILDIMMPEIDGIATMAHIKKENIRVPPVLICSSRSDLEAITLTQKLGAAGYILKPFKTGIVQAKVRQLLALKS